MAKRKKVQAGEGDEPTTVDVAETAENEMDSFLAEQVEHVTKMTSGGLFGQSSADAEASMLCIPFSAPSLRYLFSNSGYLIGRLAELVGPPASCKTPFLYEMYRWHLDVGGYYKHMIAEPKDSPDLRRSIVGQADAVRGRSIGPVQYIDQWQAACTATLQVYDRLFGRNQYGLSEADKLTIDGVDSMTAVTTEKAAEDIYEKGSASPGFSPIARFITDWARVYFTKMAPHPISFVGINHQKDKPNSRGLPEKTMPGGLHLEYAATFIMRFYVKKKYELVGGVGGRVVNITTLKNGLSTAGEPRDLDVHMAWHVDQETGVQRTWWDWDRATAELMLSFDEGSRVGRLIREIVNIENLDKTNASATCKALGFSKKAKLSEIGRAIGENAEMVTALDHLFGVRQRHPWRNGVPYSRQLRDAMASPLRQVEAAMVTPDRVVTEEEDDG